MHRLRISKIALLVLLAIAITFGCGQRLVSDPPIAKVVLKVDTLFGQELIDNYSWLRDDERKDPEVLAYVNAENEYTASQMRHTEDLQEKLFQEIIGRIKQTDLSVPVRHGDYYYYTRTEEGKQYEMHCRRKGSLEATEEVLLDINQLAEGKEFLYLGLLEVSPNHKLVAFATDELGNERFTLQFKNLETGEIYPDRIENVATSLAWASDNQTVFYVTSDDAWRSYKVWQHRLGEETGDDKLIYHETDEMFWVDVARSKDGKYLFLRTASQTSSEVSYLKADQPDGLFKIIQERTPGLEYTVAHREGRFYIVTNDRATNFKVVSTLVNKPSRANWVDLIPYNEQVKTNSIEVFRDFMAVSLREGGITQMSIYSYDTGELHRIPFDEEVYSVDFDENPEYESSLVRIEYESLITPVSIYDYNMATRELDLKKRDEVLGGYDPNDYHTERIMATADDGVQVPITLAYKKGIVLDGSNPLYLYGYGAYGISMDPNFRSYRLPLLDRGFVYARAHIRGGEEMGRQWYDDGKLLNKKNTFTDFIACGRHLIAENYTNSNRLVISGGSAGGLLIGAVINMAPDLAEVVVTGVPFVDLMNTMLDESIPLTVIEYEEWGNPNVEEYFNYMLSYSPYDNVTAQNYPHMLATAGLWDTRVGYWEAAKWVAKLRANKTDNNLLLLKTNMEAGHGGDSGRYDFYREIALDYAFILDRLGMD